jgi:hypothetical protein
MFPLFLPQIGFSFSASLILASGSLLNSVFLVISSFNHHALAPKILIVSKEFQLQSRSFMHTLDFTL